MFWRTNINKKTTIILTLVTIALVFMALSPVLTSGYMADDAINSLSAGVIMDSNKSILELTTDSITDWFKAGRFFPFSVYGYVLFSLVQSLFIYKLSILVLIIVNIAIFGYFVKLITRSQSLSLLSMAILPALFQLRSYHDPILAFAGVQQIMFLYTFGSLIFLIHYLNTSKKYYLALSIILYLVSVFTYEISYAFFILHFLVVYFYKGKKEWRYAVTAVAPFGLLSIIAISISFGIRFYYKVPLSGGAHGAYVPNFDVAVYFDTLLKQTFAALPLTYYFFNPNKIFTESTSIFGEQLFLGLFIFASFMMLFFFLFRNITKESIASNSKIGTGKLFALGVFVLILPGVLMSLSPKYQQELSWGLGYLPVYFSYFGIALLLIMIIYLLFSKMLKKRIINILLSLLIASGLALVVLMNFNNNKAVVALSNKYWLYPRNIIENAISNGLFKKVGSGSELLIDGKYSWDLSAFYRMHTSKRYEFVGPVETYLSLNQANSFLNKKGLLVYEFEKKENIAFISYKSDADQGYAILGRVRSHFTVKDGSSYLALKDARIYVQGRPQFKVSGYYVDVEKHELLDQFVIESKRLNPVSSGSDWAIYEFHKKAKFIDTASLKIE